MAGISSRDFSDLPVQRVAERFLADAKEHPALIGRVDWSAPMMLESAGRFPNLALLADPALDVRPYLEDLVSLAAGSAQQAEDVSLQSQAESKRVRRGIVAAAALGGIGLLIGAVGLTAAHTAKTELAQARAELASLQ